MRRSSRLWTAAAFLFALGCVSNKPSQPPATGGTGGQSSGGSGGAGGLGGIGGGGGGAGQSATGGAGGAGNGGGGAGGLGGSGGEPIDAHVPMDAGSDAASDGGRMTLAERTCVAGAVYGDPLPPEGMRNAAPVQGGFGFIEGPVWLEEQGVLLFSDMDFGASPQPNGPPSRVRRFTPPGSFDVRVEMGNTNGLAVQLDGQVLGCAHDVQSLVRIDPATGVRTPLPLTDKDGNKFNSPNDLTIRSDGNVYFTDPDWQLGMRPSETDITGVYRVPPSGPVELITGALDKPNGIALSPDEQTLYVGSAGADIWKHAIHADGSVEAGTVFASPGGGSDGLGVDCAGNLYVTSGGAVRVFSASGAPLGQISVAENPSNVAFGGADHKTLYITAQSSLYSIALHVPGLPY